MLAIFILAAWVGWVLLRAYLRRRDPEGLQLLIGEEEARGLHPAGYARRQAEAQQAGGTAAQQLAASHIPQTASGQGSPYIRQAGPPAAGALQPRTAAGYATVPGFDRRRADRRHLNERRTVARSSQDRRTGYDRRSA